MPIIFGNNGKSFISYATTSLEKNDEIRILLQNQNSFLVPSESYLLIKGVISALDGIQENDVRNLTSNFLAFLFTEIRIEINAGQIDQIKGVGPATTMKNYVSIPFTKRNQATLNGAFSYCVPMSK